MHQLGTRCLLLEPYTPLSSVVLYRAVTGERARRAPARNERWRVRENIIVDLVRGQWCYTLTEQWHRGDTANVCCCLRAGAQQCWLITYVLCVETKWRRLYLNEFGQLGFRTLCGKDGESLDESATALLIGHSSAKVVRFSIRVNIFVRHSVTLREHHSQRNNGCNVAGFVLRAQFGECTIMTPIVFQFIVHLPLRRYDDLAKVVRASVQPHLRS